MTVMSWDEWARHDATALAAEVHAGRVTPRELAEQAAEGGVVGGIVGSILKGM